MKAIVKVGVSACLLGEKVRYDGGHKQDRYVTDALGKFFEFVPVCPEVGSGMPVPREAMRLEGDPDAPRLISIMTRIDRTAEMLSYCAKEMIGLENAGLSGFIFKKRSPSCGLLDVSIYGDGGNLAASGSGLFAHAVAVHFPLMPLAEDEQLHDREFREQFVEKVCRYSVKK